jgi:hypothetical protein
MKWYFIFAAVTFVAMFGGMAISERAESQAKSQAVVACYQAGVKDCDKLWDKKN